MARQTSEEYMSTLFIQDHPTKRQGKRPKQPFKHNDMVWADANCHVPARVMVIPHNAKEILVRITHTGNGFYHNERIWVLAWQLTPRKRGEA